MELIKYGKSPKTEFKEQLSNIKVDVLDYPSIDKLKSYIPEFCLATWEDIPGDYTEEERNKAVLELFAGTLLPTAFETIRLTFRVSGMDLIDVTHLIRHRTLSFSAQCTADRDMREDDCVVKPSILENLNYKDRYETIVKLSKQLYVDMVDEGNVSILDARTILPRSLSSFYYVSGNIKDILQFIKTRIDEQIQPESDNIIALRMYEAICSVYPFLKGTINIGGIDYWYCNTINGPHSSNIYRPKKANMDYLDFKGIDISTTKFVYNRTRESFKGSKVYTALKLEIKENTDA